MELEIGPAAKWTATLPLNIIEWDARKPILGRDPWFRQFRITLDGPGRSTTIEAPA